MRQRVVPARNRCSPRWRVTGASRVRLLNRLCGLETEYAMRFRPNEASIHKPSKFHLYRCLVGMLRQRVLTVPAKHFKEGIFIANGGAVWFEAERPASGAGLVEGSTPECRSPHDLLVYQRAQDRMLAESASAGTVNGQLSLIKNDRDSQGNVYGAQENYEATIATGWQLWIWRTGLVAIIPILLFAWLGLLVMIACTLTYLAVVAMLYLPLRIFRLWQPPVAIFLFGKDLATGQETGNPTPAWMEPIVIWFTRLVTAPLAGALLLLVRLSGFRQIQRQLLPFLVSRSLIAGSGMVDTYGNFHLADKAPAINCVVGLGGFVADRPIFNVGHFFKTLCGEACFSIREYFDLFHQRQRLQLGLGDSNMSEVSEYLRVGTTMLVLDAIEAGQLPSVPRIRRPIRALHNICADPSLQHEIPVSSAEKIQALELQRFYFTACQRFVDRQIDVPEEANQILAIWKEALDGLQELQESDGKSLQLLGKLDWVTKKHLLDSALSDTPWPALKKIDIRYHELSSEGYFEMLKATDCVTTLVDAKEIDRAMRVPPAGTPATTRGHYIREFSQEAARFVVNWKSVIFDQGEGTKRVRLSNYGKPSVHQPAQSFPDWQEQKE